MGLQQAAYLRKRNGPETAQTFAKVGIYADQRIGEILRELPKAKNQHDVSDLPMGKTQAIKDAGFTPKTAAQLEQLAANPDVVQAVLDKAEAERRIPSRSQVLRAIRGLPLVDRRPARIDMDQSAQRHDFGASVACCEARRGIVGAWLALYKAITGLERQGIDLEPMALETDGIRA